LSSDTHLDLLVPASRDDGVGVGGGLLLVLGGGVESDGGNPVLMALVGDGVLALADGVPDLDGSVSAGRDNLSVVGRERDGKNVTSVADKSVLGDTGLQVPDSESLIPRAGDGVSTVMRDGTVLDNVGVALKRLSGNTVVGVVSGQRPDNQGLVSGSGQQNVGVVGRSSEGGNPAVVAYVSGVSGEVCAKPGHVCE
jgi:hypothetical protein